VNLEVRLVLHREIPEDEALRAQWNTFIQCLERPQVFYTWEWASAVQQAYGATMHPLLFLAYDEQDALNGIAALAVNPERNQVTFLCATTADYCDILSSASDKEKFVNEVLAGLRKQGFTDVVFTNLPADSSSVGALRRAGARYGYHFFSRTAYVCAQVELAKLERRPGETVPVLPRKKMVRRFLNAMGRNAPVRLDHGGSWPSVEAALPEFVRSHVARFLVTGLISNLARPERQFFLRELARRLSESGWLAFTRMMSGEGAFAWNYGFRFHDTWFWYQPTFESSLEKYSPGFCLLAKLIEEASENPKLKYVDLGLGAEEYKDRFSNQSRGTLYITLKSAASRHYREIGRYYVAETIRAIPRLEPAVRTLRQRWQTVRKRENNVPALARIGRRAADFISSQSEVFFYEWQNDIIRDSHVGELQTLDLNAFASATMQYIDDESTLAYILRAAARLRESNAEAFGLVDAAGAILHFSWVTNFDGFFLSELNAKVDAPSPDSVMLFDCWTPVPARGNGYYSRAVSLVAQQMRERGKRPWIFSAAGNVASIRGLEKSGFERRYSMTCRRSLWWQRVSGATRGAQESPTPEVSAHV
jgi:CelD/BcsL family acetyltransferase involved in cellulose biosynthesis